MKIFAACAFFLLALTGCAEQPPKLSNTKWPEAIFPADTKRTADFIVAQVSSEAQVIDISPTLIQTRLPSRANDFSRALYQCTVCNDPFMKVNYVLSPAGMSTKVVMQYWEIYPQYGGGENQIELGGANLFNQFQEQLWGWRNSIPIK